MCHSQRVIRKTNSRAGLRLRDTQARANGWGLARSYLNLHGEHHHDFMRIPCLGVLDAVERHDRSYGGDVLCIGETPEIERQADVPDEVWWLQHGDEMRYRHALVRRNGPQELVRGDVLEVDEARSGAYKEK
ncbi:hypothetical protein AZE42_09207 [Rhizopogon vesiculosus]|uniref:Uncharacterized protein n=1 Tax=Rhizopogon vesiculosus TaxID=180088 RepID=A0A1J8PZQ3_9AGAM|nr:hypothetical protein AZE42_09207 [Rhizopogon vesiculosus]